jgi:hypothetical protein
MAESNETGSILARPCLGGFTLLLALTLSVQAAAITSAAPIHRPLVVHAVARLIASATSDAPASRTGTVLVSPRCDGSRTIAIQLPVDGAVVAGVLLRAELLNLPPPMGA